MSKRTKAHRSYRPTLEALESRWVPSGNPPLAVADSFSVLHDRQLIAYPLANDSDPENDDLIPAIMNDADHGYAIFNMDGSFTYVPDMGYVGTDQVSYLVNDGTSDSNETTITISITNQAPSANNAGVYSVHHGGSLLDIGLLGNASDPDADALTAEIVQYPSHGYFTFDSGSGTFSYYSASDYAGSDSFTYRVHDGAAYSNVATVSFNVIGEAQITFLDYDLSANNSEEDLFAPEPGPYPLPLVDLSVRVEGDPLEGATPTGTVTFTAIGPTGDRISLGVVPVGPDGKATLQQIDSGLLAQPGLVVEAAYLGDAFFTAKTKKDDGKTAVDLRADPPVTDNPVIAPNAQNLTVVVVAGRNGAQSTLWRDSARTYYGPNAYIITNVHSVVELGARLANLPAGSITKLVIGSHGWEAGAWLGAQWFDANTLYENEDARQQIRTALANNLALIDLQCCGAAHGQTGKDNMKALADALNARVRGADAVIRAWDYNLVNWFTVDPE